MLLVGLLCSAEERYWVKVESGSALYIISEALFSLIVSMKCVVIRVVCWEVWDISLSGQLVKDVRWGQQ